MAQISTPTAETNGGTDTSHEYREWTDRVGGLKIPASKYSCLPDAPNRPRKFPRLSRPVPTMRPEYDIVVVGSGYGAGVAASQMARAGKKVAVLELGKEKWPGEYPSCLKDAAHELHTSGNAGRGAKLKDLEIGKRTGLYHLVLGEGQNVFVGNGLGGTSLLNANVFLPPDKRTLALKAWPEEIRKDPGSLDQYYERAAEMLTPQTYPDNYPPLKKLQALEKQAKALGQEKNFYRVPQTTFFHDGLNSAGIQMKASTGSGQDCTGVNDGSKNTVLVTYLADAWNWGAEIFCECEVRYVQKSEKGEGYIISFAWHGEGRAAFEEEQLSNLMWVRAKEFCFLGAGALGTTSILLRSQKRGLKASQMLGQKLSGNGDILNFAYNTDEIINGIGTETPNPKNPPGPTITGVIDARNPKTSPNVLDGYVIEEGAIPAALAPLLQGLFEAMPGKVFPPPGQYNALRHFLSRTKSRVFGPYAKGGSVNRTQTYLVMSYDSNEAILSLTGDKPYLQFVGVGTTERVTKIRDALATASGKIGGTLIDAPFYADRDKEQITVHPLGGAVMSYDGTGKHGAVNHMGRVFTGDGPETHDGLVCVDASVIPTALGVNPFATITALAERICDLLLHERQLAADETKNGKLDLFDQPKISYALPVDPELPYAKMADGTGVRFSEVMDGHIYVGDDITDFEVARNTAKGASSAASLYITVDTFSIDDLISLSDRASFATGTFSCGALSQTPLMVLYGQVRFFTTDEQVSDGTNLVYQLKLLSAEGDEYLLHGFKNVDSTMAFSAVRTWKATTTLYTTITHTDGSLVGRGILQISWRNFVDEIQSFGPTAATQSLHRKISAPLRFVKFFAKKTAAYFFSPLRPLSYPDRSTSGYFQKTPPSKTVELLADDSVRTVMKVWEPAPDTPTHEMPILFIPGASVDDQIFSLPTIQTNTIDYFTGLGYKCYVPTLRFGVSQEARKGYTAYDARFDVKAAMEFVRQEERNRQFYVVCHCLGSIATGMALLTGTVESKWICGMTCSQVFTHLRFGEINKIKSRTQALQVVYKAFAGPWFPTDSSPTSSLFQRLVDQLLRLYPVGTRGELCNSTVCHRGSLVFGRLWTHSKLNHATHRHLSTFFGGIHMNFLSHLTQMGSTPPHHSRSNLPKFEDLVEEPGNLDRLTGLKIQFLSGGANVVFDPWSTSESYDLLRHRFGTEDYERVVVPGYGHLDTWMGKDSFVDVFPRVLGHVGHCEGTGARQ
ncbi:FAD/NAD(P)-binding domain-containing protein [Byssothecium circinans]|uniref:Cholesterol oxidase n=1 Tax=Byssothecium circinans TaxID=147558 RepID=A0A6A5U8V9_9PLEO|nr:FAD/NAD(P)-binding domain-containing protein [Byssothecium circinans]